MKHSDGFFKVSPRPYAAISLRRGGEGAFRFSETEFVAKTGDITFIPANVGYEVEYKDSEITVIHLTDCNYNEVENIDLKHPDYINLLFRQLLDLWDSGCGANLSKSAVFDLLAKVEEDTESPMNDALLKCILYMEEHFTEPDLKINDIARAGSISEASLYRHFFTYYGMPPKQYFLKLRLNYAVELLLKGDTPVLDVARITGFPDSKYFSRIFKKYFGTQPSRFLGSK